MRARAGSAQSGLRARQRLARACPCGCTERSARLLEGSDWHARQGFGTDRHACRGWHRPDWAPLSLGGTTTDYLTVSFFSLSPPRLTSQTPICICICIYV